MSEAASQDPFFIIGTGRCGTTLLQRMLMGHPRISIPPETHFFSRFDPVRVVGLDPVSDGLVEGYVERCASHPWFAELGLRRESLQAALDAGTRSARDLFLWYANALLPDAPARLGEKTPHHEKYTARILDLFPQARFIHIVRDPRDVVVSLKKEHWMGGESIQRIAHHVAKVWRRQQDVAERLGPRVYRVLSYEDLVADPEAALRELCDFLGEAFDPAMLTYHQQQNTG
ncbi:MAG: sulfotransferase, partial [Phycisphaerales bacterium]|nr:sulfotransferase [Phycisphaerales bacterium]